jgi:N-methylhydantoinase B
MTQKLDLPAAAGDFDPIVLELLRTRLISIVDEAAKVVVRTSFSMLLNEANDFACVLTDPRGRLLAQNTASLPAFIGTLPRTVRHFLQEIGAAAMHPGDVLITNNPWHGSGHLNDVTLVKPIFHGERLVAFAGCCAHVPDIGGRIRSVEPREVFEEGFHIPAMKILHEGRTDESLVRLMRTNVRTPDQTVGDLFAQIGALEVMERRLARLLDDYGLDDIGGFGEALFSRSDRAMREAIAKLPDGVYRCEMQTDGLEAPFRFCIALTVRGDTIDVDYEGTSPQQARGINVVYAYTFAMTAYALKCALLPELPNNEGMFEALTVRAPAGSLLNATFPASVGGRICSGDYLPPLVFAALHPVIPDRVQAASGSPLWSMVVSGVRPDSGPFANVLFFNGGMGAGAARDGVSCFSFPNNISCTPVEIMERDTPFFIEYKRLREDSGGHGAFCGGLGQDVLLVSRSPTPLAAVFLAERTRIPAPGLAGGGPGATGDVLINEQSIDARRMHVLQQGDRLLIRTPGAGGYGEPGARDPALREADRRNGWRRDPEPR